MPAEHTYTDELGNVYRVGDAAYDYYTMKAGHIERDASWDPDETDRWFDFRHTDGTGALLNGVRICSISHAIRMGWPNTDIGA